MNVFLSNSNLRPKYILSASTKLSLPQRAVTETREVGKISHAPLFISVFPAPAVFLLDHSCCCFSENTQPSLRWLHHDHAFISQQLLSKLDPSKWTLWAIKETRSARSPLGFPSQFPCINRLFFWWSHEAMWAELRTLYVFVPAPQW